ncbi:class I SAM-dependent methyltransferase [Cohnella sp. LGH]|uniref:class I SAM-dependent methyltransferase n=1 Tax=Cohnella sp. LGH TaxID=1619153 RepID=UPI001ADD0F95|nr:class I SAM-dependent methyltransferase [Cohnella sp. LGH]QTH42270.1 class I SAM-dependent methyltransferase [Cohnella sp. LGH]
MKVKKYCLERFAFLQTRKIYVFGAGEIGRHTVEALLAFGLNVHMIIDNDSSKQGLTFEGISIDSLDTYMTQAMDKDFIIVALIQAGQVIRQLDDAGISQYRYDSIYTYDSTLKYTTEDVLQDLYAEYTDINLQMQKEAIFETAAFVKENMFHVPQFNSREMLFQSVLRNPLVNGLYLEFGVFKGESLNQIASLVPTEVVYGFDSFEGLPEDWYPGFEKGIFAVPHLPNVRPNIQLVKGWYDETLPKFLENNDQKCTFIHIDCDLYSSTRTVFNELKDRIVSGTIIVFDEYFNYPNWKNGEYKAFMEFIEETGFKFEYLGFIPRGWQVAVKIME